VPPATTQLSTKGQVVLPKQIREAHGWGPGTEFIVEETANGVLLRPAPLFPRTSLDQVLGCLKYKGKPKTIEDMDKAIARGVKRRHARGRY